MGSKTVDSNRTQTPLKKNYDDMREILRDAFIFGCYSKDYYEKLQKEYKEAEDNGDHKRAQYRDCPAFFEVLDAGYSTESDMISNGDKPQKKGRPEVVPRFENSLMDIYSLKNVDIYKLCESIRTLNDFYEGPIIYAEHRIVSHLVNNGLLNKDKKAPNDYLDKFDQKELQDLYNSLDLIKNSATNAVPYMFLQRKIALYYSIKYNEDIKNVTLWKVKTNHYYNVIDAEILNKLLYAIREGSAVVIKKYHDKNEKIVLPLVVVHDMPYGRLSLVYIDWSHKKNKDQKLSGNVRTYNIQLSNISYVRDFLTYSSERNTLTEMYRAIDTALEQKLNIDVLAGESTTRKQCPSFERKKGFLLVYKKTDQEQLSEAYVICGSDSEEWNMEYDIKSDAFVDRSDGKKRIKELRIFIDENDEVKKQNRVLIEEIRYLKDYSWCVSNMYQFDNNRLESDSDEKAYLKKELSIVFDKNKITENDLQRLRSDTHEHDLIDMGHSRLQYKVILSDMSEIIPWLRSFGDSITDVSDEKIKNRLVDTWKEALALYV